MSVYGGTSDIVEDGGMCLQEGRDELRRLESVSRRLRREESNC